MAMLDSTGALALGIRELKLGGAFDRLMVAMFDSIAKFWKLAVFG